MRGPGLEDRIGIARSTDEVAQSGDEDYLDRIFEQIERTLEEDIESENLQSQEPDDLLAAVEAWAAVTSDVLIRFYGPQSPLRQGVSGWSKKIAKRLQNLSNRLLAALKVVAGKLGASAFGISTSFTTVSVSLSWSTSTATSASSALGSTRTP